MKLALVLIYIECTQKEYSKLAGFSERNCLENTRPNKVHRFISKAITNSEYVF